MSLAARRWLRRYVVCAQSASVQRARGFTAFFGRSPGEYGDRASGPRRPVSTCCFRGAATGAPAARTGRARRTVFPAVEGLLAHAEPTTHLSDFLAAFDLVEGVDD